MPITIKNLFSKKPDTRIVALAECAAQNELDAEWLRSFTERAETQNNAAVAALNDFAINPCDKTAKAYLDLSAKAMEHGALCELRDRGATTVQQRILDRTKPILAGALAAVIETLEVQLADVRKRDNESAKDLGLDTHETESPIVRAIDAQIIAARGYLARLDTITFNQLRNKISFCLGE